MPDDLSPLCRAVGNLAGEHERLRAENADLRKRLAEQKQIIRDMQKTIDEYAEQALEDGHD